VRKLALAQELWPADLLFIHRDAEGRSIEERVTEIFAARDEAAQSIALPPVVCVVPVRMQEAWLLIDEAAIRRAAGNPNGTTVLGIPPLRALERIPDPKEVLHSALLDASELSGRRRKKFSAHSRAWSVSKFMYDFSALRRFDAFNRLENSLSDSLEGLPL